MKELMFRKYKAGIMLYALIISLVSSIISFSILSFFYMTVSLTREGIGNRKIENILDAAILTGMRSKDLGISNIEVFPSESSLTMINVQYWGIYSLVSATCNVNNKLYSKSVICGRKPDRTTLPAIYIRDEGSSVTVENNCLIEGPVYFPKNGYRLSTTVLNPQSNFKNLDLHVSTSVLPGGNNDVLNYMKMLLGVNSSNGASAYFSTLDSISIPYNDSVRVFAFDEVVGLNNCFIEGKVIVKSDKKIEVFSGATLKNIILVAPEIIIKNGFKGSIQCFSSKSIIVEENCILEYPTSIVLLSKEDRLEPVSIHLSENDSIFGSVICLGGTIANKFKPRINIDTKCFIKGLVYSDGEVNISGELVGSLYAGEVVFENRYVRNDNFLFNVKINVKGLNESFLFGNWIGNGKLEILSNVN